MCQRVNLCSTCVYVSRVCALSMGGSPSKGHEALRANLTATRCKQMVIIVQLNAQIAAHEQAIVGLAASRQRTQLVEVVRQYLHVRRRRDAIDKMMARLRSIETHIDEVGANLDMVRSMRDMTAAMSDLRSESDMAKMNEIVGKFEREALAMGVVHTDVSGAVERGMSAIDEPDMIDVLDEATVGISDKANSAVDEIVEGLLRKYGKTAEPDGGISQREVCFDELPSVPSPPGAPARGAAIQRQRAFGDATLRVPSLAASVRGVTPSRVRITGKHTVSAPQLPAVKPNADAVDSDDALYRELEALPSVPRL